MDRTAKRPAGMAERWMLTRFLSSDSLSDLILYCLETPADSEDEVIALAEALDRVQLLLALHLTRAYGCQVSRHGGVWLIEPLPADW